MSSGQLFDRARAVMPGGVNSPVRAFGAVGGTPPFIESASGALLHTVDGTSLIDFVASWGALMFGHADPDIVEAITTAATKGSSYGMPTRAEVELAELICELMPSIEVIRMVNSGTEATASVIRLARAAVGKPGIVKFEGCYHGHADPFLVKAGSGMATFGEPTSPGVPAATVADTHLAKFNDLDSVAAAMANGQIAAVIVEPVAGNMGCIPPVEGFLQGLRDLCDTHHALLIFDEVMTGFRVALGGAQARYEVTPDLTALGKVIAGGTPGAAYGGRRDLMRMISPDGPVYQAGTLSGNPLVTAAGLAQLRKLTMQPHLYDQMQEFGLALTHELELVATAHEVPIVIRCVGGMMGVFLGIDRANSWDDLANLDTELFGRFHTEALRQGVMLPPSAYEAWFLMESHLAMGEDIIDRLTTALTAAMASR